LLADSSPRAEVPAAHPRTDRTRQRRHPEDTRARRESRQHRRLHRGIPAEDPHGFDHHVGFYPGAAGIAKFADALDDYERGKGSVQFPHDEPLPLDLVATIVKFRVEQNVSKKTPARRS
jgi:hypothetical protein